MTYPDNISSVRLYADDVILYRPIHSEEDCHHLQQDLLILEEWATKWEMSFNIENANSYELQIRLILSTFSTL